MSKIKKNIWRHVLQLGVIALILGFILKGIFGGGKTDVEAYCPFGGLQSLVTFLNSQTLACTMSMAQIMMGIVLAVGVILFGKLFCGYLCPLGTITEWMGVLRKKIGIKLEIPMGSILDKALRIVKYILLFCVFYMTISSSELFCKNFDPYYAIATGFKGEITAWMVVISVILLFLGSLFINMFWCKYICPLGALSNVFRFTLTFVALLILSLILGYFGLTMQWVWLLGACCVICYLWEIIYYKSKVFPVLRVTRDVTTCNDCGICSKRCPQQIKVSELKVVKDIDCNLCGECIGSCPKGSLKVNNKRSLRWAPAIIVVALFFIALWLGTKWELPTINEYWGDPVKWEKLESFEREGMRTIKCYGSSKAFSAKMKNVPGVYGVTTYVSRFAVIVHYDPTETTQENIEKSMFTSTKRKLVEPPAEVDKLKIVTLEVERLFDRMDATYLGNIFRLTEGYYGLESEYGCPVRVKIFMDAKKDIDRKELRNIVETRELEMPAAKGKINIIKCNYELVSVSESVDTISRQEFFEYMFPATSVTYKGNLEDNNSDVEKAVYELEFSGLDKPIIQRQLPYLSSFLSTNKSILGYATALRGERQVIRITYVKGELTDEEIWEFLQSPQWTVSFKDGTVKEMDPTLRFSKEGHTLTEI